MLTPKQQDTISFALLALAVTMAIIFMVATPADAAIDPFGPEANHDLVGGTRADTPAEWSILVGRWFDDGEHDQAMSILDCESGFNPVADNPVSTAQGGWQFLKSTWGWASEQSGFELDAYPAGPNDPEQSTRLAAWLQDEYGWEQWSCYRIVPVTDWPQTIDLLSEGQQTR